MLQMIKQFCENDKQNGLLLVDMPTGAGKTHNVLDFLYQAACDPKYEGKRFLFITTMKRNLPIDALHERFTRDGKDNLFYEKVLFIDSNTDTVRTNFTKIQVPNNIEESPEYKALQKSVNRINNAPNLDEDIKQAFQERLDHDEKAFRLFIQQKLFNEFRNVSARLNAIKYDKNWQWLGELYPAVFTREKQIIFLSMDKFMLRNSPIVEPSYVWYSSDVINNSIIFIDEIDATKETMLTSIIKSRQSKTVDYIKLFKMIHSKLRTTTFPRKLTIQNKDSKIDLQCELENLRTAINNVYQKFTLRFNYKTDGFPPKTKNFLFYDNTDLTIIDNTSKQQQYIKIEPDSKEHINRLLPVIEKPCGESDISFVLNEIVKVISTFASVVEKLAQNYMTHANNNRDPYEDDLILEDAIHSVLSEFSIEGDYADFLTEQILAKFSITQNISQDNNPSFYENGFNYHCIEDDDRHDMHSNIVAHSYNITPEKILLNICKKAKVIGISATATIPTVTGNYAIDYLKEQLLDSYYKPTQIDIERMHTNFENTQCGYDNVNIHVDFFNGDDKSYNSNLWNLVFNNSDYITRIGTLLDREVLMKDSNYYKARYLRIALAYKQFIIHACDIQSFLCVLPAIPQNNHKELDIKLLNEIFEYIIKDSGEVPPSSLFDVLAGKNFEKDKARLLEELSQGKRKFIMTTYQSAGAGQNLQYKIPQSMVDELITVNVYESRGEKDFDAIYLDRPTNILVNLKYDSSAYDLVKYLYQISYLKEQRELSLDDATKYIENAFRTFGHMQGQSNSKMLDVGSKRLDATHIIMQAIGRICRTNQKRRNIYIFADSDIAQTLDAKVADDRPINYEFKALLQKAQSVTNVKLNTTANNSFPLWHKTINQLRQDKNASEWKKMRKLCLQYPTISADEILSIGAYKSLFIEQPTENNQLYYCEEDDYKHGQVWFSSPPKSHKTVSCENAKLDKMMSYVPLKDYFDQNGYATTFVPNKFILAPIIFNNIYKGALGEVAGEFLFNLLFGEELEDIVEKELFELFDYKIKNYPIYVDLKDWHENFEMSNAKYLEKIYYKAKTCNDVRPNECQCVIAANIFAEDERKPHSVKYHEVQIIEIPQLLTCDNHGNVIPSVKSIKLLLEVFPKYD